ncbi:NAD(P)H-hydrate epimerase [Halolactibacillus halophilus]|uniref:Bifunctional NAD(P)H-hydrate repair enzyme n=1 Tax=Halolactibacillus halophilus TaxID=306540 RepID=A0A1I5RTI9_9BACI|nr:NAD(P)H-hydrate dehydratase [Halolactibacillus halophilus]GEM02329.1 bifunctional NAD(P)H-hydrate repair enzyme Nnr [Halolactibacillus halophilus]SFP61845.1 NAD(P)H-hydrate epimerase [Halolactibacillus halophilus]
MKCLTSKEMQQVDVLAFNAYHMPGEVLMENAGRAIIEAVISDLTKKDKIVVVVGPGNNGGDGFVVARELKNRGYDVTVIQTVTNDKIEGEAYVHLNIMQRFGVEIIYDFPEAIPYLHEATVVIDALFGTGYKGPMREPMQGYVTLMNQVEAVIYSIDVPSGVSEAIDSMSSVVKASKTITIEAPKITAYTEATAGYYGELVTISIGLPTGELDKISRSVWQSSDVRRTLIKRERFGHKGTYGHVLLIGGCADMPGAIQLSARGALKSGAGLVSVMIDRATRPFLQLPHEVMTRTSEQLSPQLLMNYQAIAVGMGFGLTEEKQVLFQQILTTNAPVLIDADGLTLLARDISILNKRQGPTVLTPHPKEFARLTGRTVEEIKTDPFTVTKVFAKEYGVYLVLKGAYTIITSPTGDQVINTTGNSALSKGGSGDILSGIASVRMMQDESIFPGLCNAVYLHGYASDVAVKEEFTAFDITPTDVVEKLSEAYRAFI